MRLKYELIVDNKVIETFYNESVANEQYDMMKERYDEGLESFETMFLREREAKNNEPLSKEQVVFLRKHQGNGDGLHWFRFQQNSKINYGKVYDVFARNESEAYFMLKNGDYHLSYATLE